MMCLNLQLEKFLCLEKRYYTIYINYKSGAPQEPVMTGPDNSCRLDFDPELDNIPIMLNNWIRM